VRNAALRRSILRLRRDQLAHCARIFEVTRIPETTEVSTPPESKRLRKGAELIPPPARDAGAVEAMDVYVERLSGQVSAPKRLRAACSDQFGLFGGVS